MPHELLSHLAVSTDPRTAQTLLNDPLSRPVLLRRTEATSDPIAYSGDRDLAIAVATNATYFVVNEPDFGLIPSDEIRFEDFLVGYTDRPVPCIWHSLVPGYVNAHGRQSFCTINVENNGSVTSVTIGIKGSGQTRNPSKPAHYLGQNYTWDSASYRFVKRFDRPMGVVQEYTTGPLKTTIQSLQRVGGMSFFIIPIALATIATPDSPDGAYTPDHPIPKHSCLQFFLLRGCPWRLVQLKSILEHDQTLERMAALNRDEAVSLNLIGADDRFSPLEFIKAMARAFGIQEGIKTAAGLCKRTIHAQDLEPFREGDLDEAVPVDSYITWKNDWLVTRQQRPSTAMVYEHQGLLENSRISTGGVGMKLKIIGDIFKELHIREVLTCRDDPSGPHDVLSELVNEFFSGYFSRLNSANLDELRRLDDIELGGVVSLVSKGLLETTGFLRVDFEEASIAGKFRSALDDATKYKR